MKVAIIGATGKQGNLLVQEAIRQGHDVTAIVRSKNKLSRQNLAVLEKDIFSLQVNDVKAFDVVIDAFNAQPGQEEQHYTSLLHLIGIFEQIPDTRLIVVGGAGSLYADPEKTLRVLDTPGFPDAYKPTATNMARGFDALKASQVNWTYFSPAAFFDFEGKPTGRYQLGQDNLIVNATGDSYLSYAEYAVILIDELRNKAFVGKRFTAVSEKA